VVPIARHGVIDGASVGSVKRVVESHLIDAWILVRWAAIILHCVVDFSEGARGTSSALDRLQTSLPFLEPSSLAVPCVADFEQDKKTSKITGPTASPK